MKNRLVAIVTGGNRGIGLAIARLLKKRGAQVEIFSRSHEGDVRDRRSLLSFAKNIKMKHGRLDLFVNCAGVSKWKPLEDIDDNFMSELYETNVLGTLWGSQAAALFLNKGGAIVNVSSLAGKRGSANNSAYCASKFAVNGITQSLAKELGPKGIRVNAVCPVYVTTETILNSLQDPAAPPRGQSVKTYLKDFAKTQTALGRLPTAEEVAEAVYFLGTSASSAITGQCVNVDCGTLPQ
ncbi:MAG: Diacetyl reductase [(S)-acetoin forming] [Elusimicrobia bacterium]|nr:Diacetyl reductase [(S)-acetoin forming] [Elusimicrobiota bacterium]